MSSLSFQEFSTGVATAENFWCAGDWERARDTYSELLYRRLSDGAALTANELLVAERLADLAAPFGDFAEADQLYRAVAAAFGNQGEWERADAATLKRVHLALACDRLDDAMSLLRSLEPRTGALEAMQFTPEGLRAFESQVRWQSSRRPLALVQFYLECGRVLAGFGQFPDAVAAFRRALLHCAADAELARLAETPVRLALAGALVEAGKFSQAQTEIGALESRIDQAREPGYAASMWETSAKINLLKGEFAAAEKKLREVVELCQRLAFAAGRAKAATNLAELLVVLNRVHEAKELLDDAAWIAQSLSNPAIAQRVERVRFVARCREGSIFADEAFALPVLAMQAGYQSDGGPLAPRREAALVAVRPTSYLAFYESRELDFLADVHIRDLDRAELDLRWMRADFAATSSALIAIRIGVLTALLACEQGRYADAEILLSETAGEFRALGALPELYQCRRLQALCWDKLGYPAVRRAALREENDSLLEKLAAPLEPEAREAYRLNKWLQRELLLGQEVDQLARLRDQRAAASGWRSLVYGWKEFLQAGALIRRIDQTGARKDLPMWSRLLRHTWRGRTIGFLVLPNSTFTYSLGWMSLDYRIGTATRVGIRSLVKAYQSHIISLDPRSQSAASKAAAKVADALGLPALLGKSPARVRHLTFVPDDQLHGFPFAAIPLASPDHAAACLGLRWTTSIAVAGCAGRRSRSKVRTAVIAGAGQADGYAPLPEVAKQCQDLAHWLDGRRVASRVLMDRELTRTALFQSLAGADLFHFSGHGTLRPDMPEHSGLVLGEGEGDGQLVTLLDLAARPLESLAHATLAACWSADGYAFPGGYNVSFPQLLGKAGVASVLAPLWEVEDRVVSEFLTAFYAGLASGSRAEALRLAQQYVIGRGHASPYWWAGFQLYGEAGRLRV